MGCSVFTYHTVFFASHLCSFEPNCRHLLVYLVALVQICLETQIVSSGGELYTTSTGNLASRPNIKLKEVVFVVS